MRLAAAGAAALALSVATAGAAANCGWSDIGDAVAISAIGSFSNVRATEEHAYGYSVMLWRAGTCTIGFLSVADGLEGDAPIGALERVQLDARTGALSFTAKLTTGMTTVAGANDLVPSRDLFTFTGRLKGSALSGAIAQTVRDGRDLPARHVDVTLNPSPEDLELMRGPESYGEWRRQWEPILKRRGPKWN